MLFGHIELIKNIYGIPNLMHLSFYKNTNGHIGVILFFVLSGFLISYLLIDELNKQNKINFYLFYSKRVFRIWPIYYLMVLFAIIIFPYIIFHFEGYFHKYSIYETLNYLFFLPNIAKSTHQFIPGAVHLWSIGVEEQFYLIWPILILVFRKNLNLLFLIIFILFTLIPPAIDYINVHTSFFEKIPEIKKNTSSFFISFKINAMALGALTANLYYSNFKLIRFLYFRTIAYSILLFTFLFWMFGITFGTYNDEIYAILFSCIILELSTNPKPSIILENKIIKFLGRISYGVYVYHWVIVVIIVLFIKKNIIIESKNLLYINILIYLSSIFFTIAISHLSFRYLETPLIKFNKKKIGKQTNIIKQ